MANGELHLPQIDPPTPLRADRMPCEGCGNVFIHRLECPQVPQRPVRVALVEEKEQG